jgi:O-antigen/teichoic acid export membrane protein
VPATGKQGPVSGRPGKNGQRSLTLAGEAFWVGFGVLTGVAALFAGTRALTHLLVPGEYGQLALAVSLSSLAVMIFGDPVGKTAVRFYSLWCTAGKPHGFMQDLGRSLVRAAGVIGVFCVAAIVLGRYVAALPDSRFVLLTGMFAMLLILNRAAIALADAARKRRFRGIVQGSFEMLRFGLAICLVIVFSLPKAETVLAGFVMAGILVVMAHGVFLFRVLHDPADAPSSGGGPVTGMDRDRMQAFQSPLITSSICIWLVMMAERWMLTCFGSPSDVGGYAAVSQLAFIPMLLVSNFLLLFIEPILYQSGDSGGKSGSGFQVRHLNRFAIYGILGATVFLSGVLFATHPVVGTLLLGEEFRSYSWLFPWLLLAGGFFAAAQQVLLKLSLDMRTDLLAKLWFVVALVAVGGYAAGAAGWQLKGLVTAVVTVNMGVLAASLFLVYGTGTHKTPPSEF